MVQIGFVLWEIDEDFPCAMAELERLAARFQVLPFVGEAVLEYHGRFGDCHDVMREMQRICDARVALWRSQ